MCTAIPAAAAATSAGLAWACSMSQLRERVTHARCATASCAQRRPHGSAVSLSSRRRGRWSGFRTRMWRCGGALGRHNAAFTKTRARTQVLVARGDDTGASVTSARTRRSGSAAHMSLGRSGSAGGHIGSIVAGVCEANGVGIATVRPCRSVACPCVCHPLISHIWGWGTVVCICQVQCAALGWRTCRMFVRVSAPGCAASLPPPSQLQQRQLLLQLLQLRHHLTRAPLYICRSFVPTMIAMKSPLVIPAKVMRFSVRVPRDGAGQLNEGEMHAATADESGEWTEHPEGATSTAIGGRDGATKRAGAGDDLPDVARGSRGDRALAPLTTASGAAAAASKISRAASAGEMTPIRSATVVTGSGSGSSAGGGAAALAPLATPSGDVAVGSASATSAAGGMSPSRATAVLAGQSDGTGSSSSSSSAGGAALEPLVTTSSDAAKLESAAITGEGSPSRRVATAAAAAGDGSGAAAPLAPVVATMTTTSADESAGGRAPEGSGGVGH